MSWSDTRCGPAPSRSYYSTIELGSAAQDRAVSPGHRGGRRRFVFAVVVGAVVVICVCVFGGRTTARPDPTASLATRPQGMQRPRAVSGRPARAASRGAIAAGVGAAVGVARPGAAFALPDLADVQSQWNEAVAKIPGAAELPDVATVVQDKWHDAVAQVPALPTDLGAQLAAAKAQLPEAAQGLADRVPADVWTRVQAAAGALPDYGAPTYVGLGVLALTLAVVVARGRGKPKGAMASTAGLQLPQLTSMADLQQSTGMCSLHQYDTQQMRDEVLASPLDYLRVGGRALYIVGTLGWYGFTLVLDGFFSRDDPQTVQQRASQAREILIKLGPTFIKAGQVLANRPDIIRMDYMQELTLLQDNVPAFPNAEAMAIMEQQIGAPLDTVFSYVSTDPIAAASLGQVYKAKLKTGEDVAIKVQRPGIEPIIKADLCIFRSLAYYINPISQRRLGTSAELIVDEFGEKMLEELDYNLEARSMEMFGKNFADDPTVKIPWVRRDLSGSKMITMEWIDGVRCTDPQAIFDSGLDVDRFISVGVVSGLRQLLEFGLFHGDPHPGNLFAMRDGRIAYVDFGNVAEISQTNKQILIDAVVHAVNEDYEAMAGDFIQLGFLARGTDVGPIVPALEQIWQNSMGQSMRDFNFRSVTARFNELVYQYPIRVPERYALVIRSLLTQEGICMTLDPDFHFLEVAYPYVARRLLTDESPALRERLLQVLFRDDKFQWERLENLIRLSREGPAGNFDFTDTIKYGLQLLLRDDDLRAKLVMALSEGDRLRIEESLRIADLLRDDIDFNRLAQEAGQGVNDVLVDFPAFGRRALIGWAERTLAA